MASIDLGELLRYSNLLVAAAVYTNAHVINPKAKVGLAYDRAGVEVEPVLQ